MHKQQLKNKFSITRREFLKLSSSILAGLAIDPRFAFGRENSGVIRVKFGIVADSHYADMEPKANRYFRESIPKMEECVEWKDTNIPPAEIDWLNEDLKSTTKPVFVFNHQQLDCEGDFCVNNAEEVRQLLENSAKTLAVFQGHNHQGHYSQIKGIHYYTLKAMVEGCGSQNNSYAIVTVLNNGSISITGYRKAMTKAFL
jgi:alkaline phosphatase